MRNQTYIHRAKAAILSLFEDSTGRPKKRPYYMRQLQILLEKQFFPWIVTNALVDLVKENQLVRINMRTPNNQYISFFAHGSLNAASHTRRLETWGTSISKLVDSYSTPTVTHHLGKHLENLVFQELRAQGFRIVGRGTNSYNGVTWTETNHDLDFIAEHKSRDLNIGVEVKNRLGLIEKKQLITKLRICEHLDIVPVLAVRWIKPYFQEIRDYGGFSWMFKTQMYPLGYENFVKNLWDKLQLPVSVHTLLPEKTINIFDRWVCTHA